MKWLGNHELGLRFESPASLARTEPGGRIMMRFRTTVLTAHASHSNRYPAEEDSHGSVSHSFDNRACSACICASQVGPSFHTR
jgi:hypothetical protein